MIKNLSSQFKKMKKLALLLFMVIPFWLLSYSKSNPQLEVNYTSGVIYNDGKVNYASLGTIFKITAADNESGLKNIFYLTDRFKNFIIYTKPFGGFNTEGKHFIAYKMEDNVGNVSNIKHFEFITDLKPPQVFITLDQNAVNINNIIYLSGNNTFHIHASDQLSGVKSIEYAVDSNDFKPYLKDFQLDKNTKPGRHSINFKATDHVNNASGTYNFNLFLDPKPPVVDFIINPAAIVKDKTLLISSESQIIINAKDAESEIKEVLYSISGGKYKVYKKPLSGLASGKNIVKAKAFDLAGNESREESLVVFVDSVVPEGNINLETLKKIDIPMGKNKEKKTETIEKKTERKAGTKKEETVKPLPVWGIFGNVYDMGTKQPVKDLEILVTNAGKPQQEALKLTNEQGDFRVQLEKNAQYKIILRKKGFFDYTTTFTTEEKKTGWHEVKKYMRTEVQKVKTKAVLDFGEIHFESGSFEIGHEAKITLDKIADFLIDHENIVVDLRAHTDSKGDSKANMILSSKRAVNAVNYLVGKGISRKRISPKGFGETKIKNHCKDGVKCSDNEHAVNRRVELFVKQVLNADKYVERDYKRYIIEDYP